MEYLKKIPPIVVYVLLVPAIWLLVYYVATFSPIAAVWVMASLAAVEAVAVVVLMGFGGLYMISLIFSSVESVIQRMWPSQLYLQPENIFRLTGRIVVLLGITLKGLLIHAIFLFTCPGGLGCSDWGAEVAMVAERETAQTAMNAMMADKNITTVTPNDDTNNSLGVNTWTDLPEGPGAASLDGLLRKPTTFFYYCWDSKGNVYTQNKKDGVRAEPDDAKKQRPCKKAP